MPTLSVVIPVHNKWELTAACLRSLAEHTPGGDVAVIVVDNASADDTSGACPALGSSLFGRRFRYRRFVNNRNFGPACNAGAALAESDLLFFLNKDALAAEPDLVGVGPLLAYPDDTVQHLGIVITPAGGSIGHLYAGLPLAHPLARRRRRFPAITGAALMVSRALFLEAGGFCEAYVNGFEDVDFCLALAENGGVMSVIPESRVIHFESQTPQRRDHDEDNGRLLRARRDLSRFVNMPALAEEDDYVLRVEPDLQVRFGVPEERRKALLRRLRSARPFRPDHCLALLDEEPLWEEGYEMLATLLENAGRREEALAVWHRHLRLTPSLEAAERALRILRQLNADPGDLAEAVERWRAGILDEEGHAAKLANILALLRRDGPVSLIPAYEQAAMRAAELRMRWRTGAH